MSPSDSASSDGPTEMPPSPVDGNIEDMLVNELRGYICKEAGKRSNWRTPLSKETLNAIHAHLTGQYAVPKPGLHDPDHPEWKSRDRVFAMVAYTSDITKEEPRWHGMKGDGVPTYFHRSELQELARELRDTQHELLSGDDAE